MHVVVGPWNRVGVFALCGLNLVQCIVTFLLEAYD